MENTIVFIIFILIILIIVEVVIFCAIYSTDEERQENMGKIWLAVILTLVVLLVVAYMTKHKYEDVEYGLNELTQGQFAGYDRGNYSRERRANEAFIASLPK